MKKIFNLIKNNDKFNLNIKQKSKDFYKFLKIHFSQKLMINPIFDD